MRESIRTQDGPPVINDPQSYLNQSGGLVNNQYGIGPDSGVLSSTFELGHAPVFQELEALYKSSSLANFIVTYPVKAALMNGRRWLHPDKAVNDLLAISEQKLDYFTALENHYNSVRLYGGAYMFPIFRDPVEDQTRPFYINEVKPDSMISFRHLDRWSAYKILKGTSLTDPLSEEFLAPYEVVLAFSGSSVNATRVIITEGEWLEIRQWMNNNWFSNSVLSPIMRDLKMFEFSKANMADSLRKSTFDVLGLSGLKTNLSDPQGSVNLRNRVNALNYHQSSNKITVIDAEDQYHNFNVSFAGYTDAQSLILGNISASTGIPVAYMKGESKAGLAASGASKAEDNRINQTIRMLQNKMAQTMIHMDRLLIADAIGFEFVGDEDFKWEWVQSDHTSPKEKAENMAIELNNLKLAKELGVIDENELKEAFNSITNKKIKEHIVPDGSQIQSWK